MELKFSVPRFFSETRFPNYSAIVLKGFVENYPAIIRAIVEVQELGMAPGASANQKKKADASAGLQCQIYSLKFALTVAGMADCYSLFSKTVNILQKINMLPHVKFDAFEECRGNFEKMSSSRELKDCPACSPQLPEVPAPDLPATEEPVILSSDEDIAEASAMGSRRSESHKQAAATEKSKCKWPLLHKLITEYKTQGTIRNVQMCSLASDPLRPGTRSATLKEGGIRLLGEDDIIMEVLRRCKDVSDYLHGGLTKVYNKEDRRLLESIRSVLDLESRVHELQSTHFAFVASQRTAEFIKACKVIDTDIDSKYELLELRLQYRHHLKQLAAIASSSGSNELSSMDIFGLLLSREKKFYEGCEAVMDVMTQAAVLMTSEGLVEGWISIHEQHSPKSRPLSSEAAESELMIAVNGPEVQYCQGVVEEAMVSYCRKLKKASFQGGHFVRRSNNIKQYCVSSAVDSLFSKPPKVEFMS